MNKNKKKKVILSFNFLIVVVVIILFGVFSAKDIWYQEYTPIGNSLVLSTIVALLPAILLFVLMVVFKKSAFTSALSALLLTGLLGLIVWKMPINLVFSSVSFGMATAIFPILWTLASAVWIFNMLQKSGYFEVIKESLKRVSYDRRIQTLLIGFAFIALLESLAAFGAPIAIGVSMLVGIGFPPLLSATVALMADTAPSAWGTQGMPLMILSSVTGVDIGELGMLVGRQTPLISLILPLILVFIVAGRKGLRGVLPIALISGFTYFISAFLASNFISPLATGVVAGLASIVAILVSLKFWQPKNVWVFPNDPKVKPKEEHDKLEVGKVIRAWSPYIVLVVSIILINSTPLKDVLSSISTVNINWPGLHDLVIKSSPVVSSTEAYGAVFNHSILTSGGTIVFFSGIVTIFLLKLKIKEAFKVFVDTLKDLFFPGLTIVCILAIAYLMNYSGMTYTIGLLFSSFSLFFPLATVFMGMFGCSLGGSVAGSNALFGNLAVVAGEQIGVSPSFSAATLCSGGTLGKSFTPQNLVIANTVLKIDGLEGKLIGRVIGITLFLTLLLGIWAMIQYNLIPWIIS